MQRIKMAFKAAIVPSIIGVVALIIGIVLLVVGLIVGIFALLIAGIFVAGLSIGLFALAYFRGKARMHAICPECKKFMGDTDKEVNFSYVINEYKPHYDNNGKFLNYTYYFNCSVVCPHCGNSVMFNESINAKTESQANTSIHNYLQGIFKIKK